MEMEMQRWFPSFMVMAGLGFILSAAAHLCSLFGIPIPGGKMVMGLHLGVFIVWIPTFLASKRATRGAPKNDHWKLTMAGCPGWMQKAVIALGAYALLNFILAIWRGTGQSEHAGSVDPSEVRGFSGHSMFFYGVAFATLLSFIRKPDLLNRKRCSGGHAVSPTDEFCPTCGKPVEDEEGEESFP